MILDCGHCKTIQEMRSCEQAVYNSDETIEKVNVSKKLFRIMLGDYPEEYHPGFWKEKSIAGRYYYTEVKTALESYKDHVRDVIEKLSNPYKEMQDEFRSIIKKAFFTEEEQEKYKFELKSETEGLIDVSELKKELGL